MSKLKKYEKTIAIILFAFAFAMGIVSVVLINLGETNSVLGLMALGIAAIGLGGILNNQ